MGVDADETRFFIDLGILFLAALGGAALALVLRQPLIVGYVVAGIAVGPFTPGARVQPGPHAGAGPRERRAERLGTWVEERVNARDDYLAYFHEKDVPKPAGIAVLTDSDDTDSRAQGDYAKLRACAE